MEKNREALQGLPILNDLRLEQLCQVIFRAIRTNKLEANKMSNAEIVAFEIFVFGNREACARSS